MQILPVPYGTGLIGYKKKISHLFVKNVFPQAIEHNHDNRWSENGPPGSVFAASPSGWFDISKFNQWFDTVLIPHISKLPRN